jgi:peptide deformylase
MTTLRILVAPDPILQTVAPPVTEVNAEIRKIVADMLETVDKHNGAGLAATQVGILKRIFVVTLPKIMDKTEPRRAFINPEITYFSDETWDADEGCLSLLLDERFKIKRSKSVQIKYLNEQGHEQQLTTSDWFARAIQHELDHLNGVLITDYISKIKRNLIMKKLIKYKKTLQL